jgi:hypothetical protein
MTTNPRLSAIALGRAMLISAVVFYCSKASVLSWFVAYGFARASKLASKSWRRIMIALNILDSPSYDRRMILLPGQMFAHNLVEPVELVCIANLLRFPSPK